MKIIMIRHGETTWNAEGKLQGREDVPLSEKGRLQAIAAGRALRLYPFSGHGPVIISSPLQRAMETARLIGGELQIKEAVQSDACLLERDYGAASGLTKEERAQRYPDWKFPGLEAREAAEQRIVQGIKRIAEQYAEHDLILVSHGEISHIFLAKLRGEETQTGRSALQNASISCLAYTQQKGFEIEYYNQTAAELEKLLKEGKKSHA